MQMVSFTTQVAIFRQLNRSHFALSVRREAHRNVGNPPPDNDATGGKSPDKCTYLMGLVLEVF